MARLQIYEVAFAVGAVTGLSLIAALLTQKRNAEANRLLAGAVFCTILLHFRATVETVQPGISYRYLILRLTFATNMFLVLFLYLYVAKMTDPAYRILSRRKWFLIPVLVASVWAIGLLSSDSSDKFVEWEHYARVILITGALGVAIFLSHLRLLEYDRKLKEHFSELQSLRLHWLKGLLVLFTGLLFCALAHLANGPHGWSSHILAQCLTVIILVMSFLSLRQSMIFLPDEPPVQGETRPPRFTEEQLAKYKQRILEVFDKDRPYLDPALRLADLSARLSLKPYETSEVINRSLGSNFYELVNRYRIAEAKKRLADPACEHLTILAIANECGFNSKSSFNETFKKMTGKPPSAFRKGPTS